MWSTVIGDARQGHPGAWRFAVVCVVCAGLTGLASLVDGRLVAGAPVWHKPTKFFLSSAIYTATIGWYLAQLRRTAGSAHRVAGWLGTSLWLLLGAELSLIVLQAARGTGSHFNIATPIDAGVFAAMGILIALLAVAHALLWLMSLRAASDDRARLSACRWGAGLTLAGLLLGTLMLGPRPEQLAALRAGRPAGAGAHAVGVADGGPGLPFVNWSRDGGDHRVAHFVGLHALQALPLVFLALPRRLGEPARLTAVRVSGAAYGVLTFLLVQQAKEGRPLLAPGPVLAGAILGVLVLWAAIMLLLRLRQETVARA